MNPGKLELDFPGRVLDWPGGLKVGDEVVIVARGIVRAHELDLVDVTGFGAANPPELTPGESTVKVTLADAVLLDAPHSPRTLIDGARGIGVGL